MNVRCLLAFVALACLVASSRAAEHTTDTLDMVRERLGQKTAVLLDVRESKEWDAGHVRGAISVPFSILGEGAESKDLAEVLMQQLPKNKIIYVHCSSGGRCLTAADVLKKMGYETRPLKSGYQDLIEAGFPKAAK